jgi:hypothetical protein
LAFLTDGGGEEYICKGVRYIEIRK